MPKSSKLIAKSSKSDSSSQLSGDFTIHYYANAEGKVPFRRMKKAAANATISEVHSIKDACSAMEAASVVSGATAEPAWYDKDLDEFDIDTDNADLIAEEGTDSSAADNAGTTSNQRQRRHKGTVSKDTGVVYPVDLWYMLGNFIYPEDLSTFARICKDAYMVTNSIHFWKNVYHRYSKDLSKLPDYLQPMCLERVHGLRQRVIRALYYVYPLFMSRTVTSVPFENQPICYSLIGHVCLVSWHEPVKNMWNFNFKFRKERMGEINSLLRLKGEPQNLSSGYRDLHHNPENDSYVLCVLCQNFTGIPPVMGLVLSNLNLRLSQGMRYFSLRLMFDTSFKQVTGAGENYQSQERVLVLDPVVDIRVFPWWHPKYPHEGM